MIENIVLLITAILIVILALIRSSMRDLYLDYEYKPCKGNTCKVNQKKAKLFRKISTIILYIEQVLTIIAICSITLSIIQISLNHIQRYAS